MVYLDDVGALARVCYHAQELSCLTALERVNPKDILYEKQMLDEAFREMFLEEVYVN